MNGPWWSVCCRRVGSPRRSRWGRSVARGIPSAAILPRILLFYLACGCSLAETALRAEKAGWCRVSVVALIKRLRSSEGWLNWLCQQLWAQRGRVLPKLRRRVRVVDATMVTEGGSRGSQWRIHFSLNLGDLRCDHFELSDQSKGESLRHISVRPGEWLLADRGLMRATGITSVTRRRAHVLGRVHLKNVPLFSGDGRPLRALARLRKLPLGRIGDWRADVHDECGSPIVGRLIALRRSARSREKARRRVERKAKQHGSTPSRRALELADYVAIWTDLPRGRISAAEAAELYRQRWQIELALNATSRCWGWVSYPNTTPKVRALGSTANCWWDC